MKETLICLSQDQYVCHAFVRWTFRLLGLSYPHGHVADVLQVFRVPGAG